MVTAEPLLDQILVVDDEVSVRKVINQMVSKMGFKALEAHTVSSALGILRRESVSLMLLDIQLKGSTGVELPRNLQRQNVKIPTIVVSGFLSDTIVRQLLELRIEGVVSKPFTYERLTSEIRKILDPEGASLDSAMQGVLVDPEEAIREKRTSPRVSVRLPIRLREGQAHYMKLVSISATGFQINLADLDLLKDRSKTKVFEFEVSIVGHLMWINANPNGTFAIG